MGTTIKGTRFELVRGDITEQRVDAIVNAANAEMVGGGGVDGAIHRSGGPAIMEELNANRESFGRVPAGEAVVTGAGDLPASWVIHAVGPIWRGGTRSENIQLERAYWRSLELAEAQGARTVAFPSISTGAYGFPVDQAAEIALMTLARYCTEHEGVLDEVRMVLFSEADLTVYTEEFERMVRTKLGTP